MTTSPITQAQARSELDRRATPHAVKSHWVYAAKHISQASNASLKLRAGEGYVPTPRSADWTPKGKAKATAKVATPRSAAPLGSKADKAVSEAAQAAFTTAFAQATQCKQYAGKLAAGYVRHGIKGEPVTPEVAIATAVATANTYVRKADRVNA